MDSIIFHSSECDWIISPQSFSLWDSNAVRNTQTPHHHPNMLPMSDKTSRRCFECCWRQCEAPWLVNWQKPLCQTAQSFNNAAWASVSEAAGPIPSSFFSGLSFLSIYSSSLFHNLVFFSLEEQRVSNYLRAIHYRWHPPHCTAKISGVQEKMGFAFTLCSSVLMKRKIEGRKAFIFWQNATPGHESLLLLSDYLLSEEYVKGSWSCLREHRDKVLIWAVNHLEEAFVTWDKLITPPKGSNAQDT